MFDKWLSRFQFYRRWARGKWILVRYVGDADEIECWRRWHPDKDAGEIDKDYTIEYHGFYHEREFEPPYFLLSPPAPQVRAHIREEDGSVTGWMVISKSEADSIEYVRNILR